MKTFRQFLTEETETKEQLNEAWLPKETALALSFENTGNSYLDNNYEISFFEVTSEMIDLMIKKLKKEDPKEWVYNSGCENEKEAKEEIEWFIKTLNEWMKFKLEEESLLQDISIKIEMKGRNYFEHDEFVKDLKMYLKNFSK